MRLLLVEDDVMLGEALVVALEDADYRVDWVNNTASARSAIQSSQYQALLLDLGLPGQDGLSLLTELRFLQQHLPVIILTARDDLVTRVQGLDLGADDYLVKPFSMSELLARLRAVIRRYGGQTTNVYRVGALSLDTTNHVALFKDQEALLSLKEVKLLKVLMLAAGQILSRSILEERVYGWNEQIESNAIDFLIHGIRKKLGSEVIKNIRGAGWMVLKG